MDEKDLQLVARHLRKPEGVIGKGVALNMNTGNELINITTIELLSVHSGDYVLEIGMANGLFVKNIVAHDATVRYVGCDFSATMVAEAERLNRRFRNPEQVQFIRAAAHDLPFDDNTFDKTFNVNTLYFWEDPVRELAEIYRVLKPGGTLLVSIRPSSTMKEVPFTKFGDFQFYTKDDVLEVLKAAGFYVTSIIEKEEPEQHIVTHLVQVKSLFFCCTKRVAGTR